MLTTVMTTAPRGKPTIEKTLESLARAKVPAPTIFAEPGSYLPTNNYILNEKKLGVWDNWLQAARFGAYSGSDYVLTMQDDIEVHPDLMNLIESLLPFKEDVGCISLFASHIYGPEHGFRRIKTKGFWGTLCMLYPSDVLNAIIKNPFVQAWRGLNPADKRADIIDDDMAVGQTLRRLEKKLYVVVPSPVKHTGEVSSIRKPHAARPPRQYTYADFNKPLMPQLQFDFKEVCYAMQASGI